MASSTIANQTLEHVWLRQLIIWLGLLHLGLGLLSMTAFYVTEAFAWAGNSLIDLGYVLLLVVVWQLLGREKLYQATGVMSTGLLLSGLINAVLLPDLWLLWALSALVAVAAGLPYLSMRSLHMLCIAAWIVVVTVLLLAVLIPFPPPAPLFAAIVLKLGFIAMMTIILFLLWRYRQHITALIAQIRSAENARRKGEEMYDTLIRNFPSGAVLLFDHDLRYCLADGVGLSNVGLSRDLLEGQTIWEVLPADASAKLAVPYRSALAGIPQAFEVSYQNHYYLVNVAPVRDEHGTIIAGLAVAQDITERKQAEEERDRFFDLAQDMLAILDFDGFPRRLNLAWVHTLGFPLETLLATSLYDLIHPADQASSRSLFQAAMAGVPGIAGEYQLRCTDGSYRWIAWNVTAAPTARLLYMTARDITERRQAEETLRASESRYQVFSEMTSDYIYILDINEQGDIATSWANDAFSRILEGYTPQEIDARGGFRSIVYPEDMPIVLRRASVVLAGNDDVSEFRIITKRGNIRWLRAFSRPLWDADQQRVTRVLGAMQDITHEKQAEAELKASEDRYRHLVELNPDAIFVHVDYSIVFINAAGLQLFGASSPDQLIGRSIFDLVHPNNHDLVRNRINQVIEHDINVPLSEFQYIRLDGTIFDLEATSGPLTYNGQQAVQSIARDITARKRAEAERLNLERKLQETQRLESLGLLAGGIAHDFNNLLMGILGNVSLALMELSTHSPAYESVVQIERAAQRAADLTRQMLAYAGKGRFVIHKINLNALVAEMAHLLRASISKKIMLNSHFAPHLPAIEGDASQIRQVVMNLITNAAEAIGDQQGTITLHSQVEYLDQRQLAQIYNAPDLTAGTYVVVSVTDTGCGMDEATQRRIFEPFFTTKFTGRGLGLAAVLGIMRSHRGSITVQSMPGVGSTFTLLLPAVSETAEQSIERPPAPTGLVWPSIHNKTVLVIDDEEDVREVVARMLQHLGCTVLLANDGDMGLELFQARINTIDCVLLDITMPRLSGEQVFQEIKCLCDHMPIILMSGYTEQEALSRFANLSGDAFLQKPFTATTLRKRMEYVFKLFLKQTSLQQDTIV